MEGGSMECLSPEMDSCESGLHSQAASKSIVDEPRVIRRFSFDKSIEKRLPRLSHFDVRLTGLKLQVSRAPPPKRKCFLSSDDAQCSSAVCVACQSGWWG
eukprot:3260213-Rhodomonas_salina.4